MSEHIRFPVAVNQYIDLDWPRLVTEEEWTRIMAILELMKPGFVSAQRAGDAAEEE